MHRRKLLISTFFAFVYFTVYLFGQNHLPGGGISFEATDGTIEEFKKGSVLFSDRGYTILSVPDTLKGSRFIKAPISCRQTLRCLRSGLVFAITPISHPENSLADELVHQGFVKLNDSPFQLFGTALNDRACVFSKEMKVGETFTTRKWVVLTAFGDFGLSRSPIGCWLKNDGEVLYNGIRLPEQWPPKTEQITSNAPMDVPYLEFPPPIIPIDVGRQLFVDDFLVESTDLSRTFHTAEKYEGNPVFRPETPAELRSNSVCYLGHGGVFYDPQDALFKMWYSAGDLDGALAFATSPDAFTWSRPDMGLPAGGNLILPRGGRTRGSHAGGDNCVWLDTLTTNSTERIKFMVERDSDDPHWLMVSPDGRSWAEPVGAGRAADYCSFFFNPFRKLWVYSVKRGGPRGRCRFYAESSNFLTESVFDRSVYWCNADCMDDPDPEVGQPAQLYSLNAVAYESLMLGMFYIHLGPPNDICGKEKRPKLTELKLGFSRDGFHWQRPDRRAFIAASRDKGTWDRGYLHSTAGICLVGKDRLIFPYCGFSGLTADGEEGMYCGASIGLAMLRRDGFVSMNAGAGGGTLTTRPIQFSGKHVFVNLDAPEGSLKMEIQDVAGNPIKPFTLGNSIPLTADTTIQEMTWKDGSDVSVLAGRPVRFLFELENGSLYSFWVSRGETGRSDGYLAAGGPGYTGPVDTVGTNAFCR